MEYDSDSEDLSDREEYTETSVLLGYPSKEPTGDTISHLGGHPTWLTSMTPPGAFAKCKVCHTPMSLLLELNGDLPEHFPNNERRLYIFTCRRKACTRKSGSIRALREVRKLKPEKSKSAKEQTWKGQGNEGPHSQPPQQDLGAALFGASAKSPQPSSNVNPFSMPKQNGSSAPINPFAPLPHPSTLAAIPPQQPEESQPTPSQPSNPFAPLPPTSTLTAIPPQAPEEPKLTQPHLSETFASKLRVSNSSPKPPASDTESSEPWPEPSAFPTPYPQLNLDAEYETLTPTTQSSSQNTAFTSKIQYDEDDATTSSSASRGKDTFESSLDTQFLRFSTRLSQNPEQVLRYEFKGVPLLYSSSDAVAACFPSLFHPKHSSPSATHGQSNKIITATSSSAIAPSANKIPRCASCGSPRVFELQLVPGLISALEDEAGIEDLEEDGMEWGTIVLGVCERDCCSGAGPEDVQWHEEWVGVQWEERIVRK